MAAPGGAGGGVGALAEARARARAAPGAPAVAGLAGGALTAGALWARAAAAARALRALVPGPLAGRCVVLGAPGELQEPLPQLVLLLAAGVAGAWFAPVDCAQWPVHRLAQALAQCEAAAFVVPSGPAEEPAARAVAAAAAATAAGAPCAALTYEAVLAAAEAELPAQGRGGSGGAAEAPELAPLPRRAGRAGGPRPDFCYFTSGTTGAPKGVLGGYAQMARYARGKAAEEGLGPGSRVLLASAFTFDPFLGDTFAALLSGAVLCLADRRSLHLQMARTLAAHRATHVCCTPGMWSLAGRPQDLEELYREAVEGGRGGGRGVAAPGTGEGLLSVSLGGEAMPRALIEDWGPRVRLRNVYGTTEACVYQCSQIMHPDGCGDPRRIGEALPQSTAHVLDPQTLEEVPVGSEGELFIGGGALSFGYLQDAELTAAKFVLHPEKGRLYRTGDRARPLRGVRALELLGRQDLEVKVNGIRVDLGGVNAVLADCGLVAQAHALVLQDGGLTAYLALAGVAADPLTDAAIRIHMETRLPSYAVPQNLRYVSRFPVSMNGKLDVPTLLTLSFERAPRYEEELGTSFQGHIETLIYRVWHEMGLPVSTRSDNFKLLGGDSLAALRFVMRLKSELAPAGSGDARSAKKDMTEEELFGEIDGRFSPAEFLARPVLHEYAAFIESHAHSAPDRLSPPERSSGARLRGVFLQAVKDTRTAVVESFLQSCPELANADFPHEMSPLHVAVAAGDLPTATLLLKAGAKVYGVTEKRVTPAHIAAGMQNGRRMLSLLIAAGTSPLVKDKNKQTLAHHAARQGCVDNIPLISELGCALDAQDRWGRTPMHWAILNGHTKFVDALLDIGCSPNNVPKSRRAGKERQTSLQKESPLDLAWRKFPKNEALLSKLLKAGAISVHMDDIRHALGISGEIDF